MNHHSRTYCRLQTAMDFGHILVFFMTVLMSSTGSRFEDHVFVQTGDSVKLDVKIKALPHFSRLVWMKDQTENIVRLSDQSREIKRYKDRVDFSNTTFSLTLWNMQKTNSGLYRAKILGEKEEFVAEHNVSVIDPVDPPVLNWNATMISVNSCMVNVSCSGHDRLITEIYHSNNCTQEEVTSFGIQTLTLYCIENVVICNYSNPVSWKNDTKEITQLCNSHESIKPKENNTSFPLYWLSGIAGVSLLVFSVVSVICCSHKKHKSGDQQNDQTVYAQVQPKNEVQRPLEMLEKSANPQTVYGFTGEHKQTHNTSQTMPSPQIEEQAQTENHPRTTYSTVGKHQNQNLSLATEPDHTIYSVVCKSTHNRQK
ncbi:natural killer cell receptor 2B4-like [Carassius auratus]|uniref:Natural killer cell receptor 2B4-like n=1 Tax=Carassius auratus TaxID=7957 RepID=A0A6P6QA44_CARAU|nr:natural killer cell receptor 2B4-like [Carassius auratus]XP_026130424.1 natural killer cell receptor 2B4-like [Carassius auratus]